MILAAIIPSLYPVILLITLFYLIDVKKEPWRILIKVFIYGGSLSIVFALMRGIVFPFISETGSFNPRDYTLMDNFIKYFLFVGFGEEISKFLAFLIFAYHSKEFDEWYDGILYGVTLSLGFAFIENILYLSESGSELRLMFVAGQRGTLSIPTHTLLGGIMGYFMGKAKLSIDEDRVPLFYLLAVIVPSLLHGLFDFSFTVIASPLYSYYTAVLINIGMITFLYHKIKESQREKIF